MTEHSDDVAAALERFSTQLHDLESKVVHLSEERSVAPTGDGDAQEATRLLASAQRTADRAVAEAEAEAQSVLADARAASERLVDEARTRADDEYAARRDELQASVQELTAARDRLRADLAGIDEALARVDDLLATQRSTVEQMRSFVGSLRANLDQDRTEGTTPPVETARRTLFGSWSGAEGTPADPAAAYPPTPLSAGAEPAQPWTAADGVVAAPSVPPPLPPDPGASPVGDEPAPTADPAFWPRGTFQVQEQHPEPEPTRGFRRWGRSR